jgi:flagellar capping protein FliD
MISLPAPIGLDSTPILRYSQSSKIMPASNTPGPSEATGLPTSEPKNSDDARKRSELQILTQENQALEDRLRQLKHVLNDAYKEYSLQKMTSTIMVGSLRLDIDSVREDRTFLIEKYNELKRKIMEATNDLRIKEEELTALKAVGRERANSI